MMAQDSGLPGWQAEMMFPLLKTIADMENQPCYSFSLTQDSASESALTHGPGGHY